MDRFEGMGVLVTGGTSGIGAECARHFAAEGARVMISGRREDAGRAVVAGIRARGGDAKFMRADVTRPDDIVRLVDETVSACGRIDIAFNNAGIAGEAMKPLHEHALEGWETVMAANLTSVFLCMKHEISAMLKTGGGVIVNNASAYGLKASTVGHTPYTVSKHGVVSLTRTAAVEYATANIRVNAVCPGWTHSEMVDPVLDAMPDQMNAILKADVPMNRVADTAEIARAVLWLASGESSYVTGHALCVDGGWVAR
ncbi:MAG: SDR family oxidoreductase [Betaproteobacteria bacterium]|nr:SDR family oxidoreductase [Betaproteobacteria bacterium]